MPDRANETMRHDSQNYVSEARARYIPYLGNETMRLEPQKDTGAKCKTGTMRHDSQKYVSEARARYIPYLGNEKMRLEPQKDTGAKCKTGTMRQ